MEHVSSNQTNQLAEGSIRAVVTRCGCGDPWSHIPNPCPSPRAVEDKGVVAYYHRRWWKRWAWAVRQWWKKVRAA